MWSLLLLLGVAWPQPVAPCDRARTTVRMEQCMKDALARDDRNLSALEKRVRDALSGHAATLFDSAATAWRAYREQECRGVYEANSGGTIAASSLLGCKIELTKSRTSVLGKMHPAEK